MDSQHRPARDTYTMDYPRDVSSKGKTAPERDAVCGGGGTSYRESRGNSDNEGPQQHMCILVLGPTGSGKSTFIAKASGMQDSARMIGHGLDSHTAICTPYQFAVALPQSSSVLEASVPPPRSLEVTIIDTPGFNDTSRNDLDILHTVASCISSPSVPPITGIIFTHRITENRVTGSCRLNLDIVKGLAGESFYPRVAMLTTMWNTIPSQSAYDGCVERESQIASSAGYWGPVAAKGGGKLRFDGTSESAGEVLQYLYGLDSVVDAVGRRLPRGRLQLQTELERGATLDDTVAGMVIVEDRRRREKQLEEELREMKEEEEEKLREERSRLDVATASSEGRRGYSHGHRGTRAPHTVQYRGPQRQMAYDHPQEEDGQARRASRTGPAEGSGSWKGWILSYGIFPERQSRR